MSFEFISQNDQGVICSCAASTVFLIWQQICHYRLISQLCPEFRWGIGLPGLMTRNTTGEQNMKNGLSAAVGWIWRIKLCVCLLHRWDEGFLLVHASGNNPTTHLGTGCDRALSTSSTCLTTTAQPPSSPSADRVFRETDEHWCYQVKDVPLRNNV